MPTLRETLHQAVDGSFAIDAKQRIIYWDAGCEELLGYSAHWALGRPCDGVMRGCKPGTETGFCQQNCRVANLANDIKGPKSFPLQVQDRSGNALSLSVSIILVPSTCKNNWHVMHLLHKGIYPDVLTAIDNSRNGSNVSSRHQFSKRKSSLADESTSRLTPRETEVLSLLSEGISGAVIAQRLCISHTTVRNHIQHIQAKLGVHSQTEAVAYAYRHNFL